MASVFWRQENLLFLLYGYQKSYTYIIYTYILGVRIHIMPRARHWKNSMNNHVILKGVDVEVMKVIQLASEVHN